MSVPSDLHEFTTEASRSLANESVFDLLVGRDDVILASHVNTPATLYTLPELGYIRHLIARPRIDPFKNVFHIERLSNRLLACSTRNFTAGMNRILLFDLLTETVGDATDHSFPGCNWHLTKIPSSPLDSSDVARFASTTVRGEVFLWKAWCRDDGSPNAVGIGKMKHVSSAYCIACASWMGQSGWVFVAGEMGGKMCVFDVETQCKLHTIESHTSSTVAMDSAEEVNAIFSGQQSSPNWVRVWDVRDPDVVPVVIRSIENGGFVGAVRYVPEKQLILVLHGPGDVAAYDFRRTAQRLSAFSLHRGTGGSGYGDVCACRNSDLFVSVWESGTVGPAVSYFNRIDIFEVCHRSDLPFETRGTIYPRGGCQLVKFHPFFSHIVAYDSRGARRKHLVLFDTDAWKEIARVQLLGEIRAFAFEKKRGRYIYVAVAFDRVIRFELSSEYVRPPEEEDLLERLDFALQLFLDQDMIFVDPRDDQVLIGAAFRCLFV